MIRKIYFTLLFWMACWGIAEAQTIKVTGRKCEPEQGCNGDSTRFELTGVTASSWNWTFQDPNSPDPQANRSTKAKPAHLYLQPGSYNVKVTVNLTNGKSYTRDTTIRISALPPAFEFFQGKEDTTICKDNPLVLDPYDSKSFQGTPPAEGTVKYLWYPTGDTTRTITVTEKGCYSVEVMNADSCTVTDRINVKICGESDQQASKWYFGSNAGINFEGGQPSAITDGKINTPEGTSSISNRKGDLLFYTDGITIYDAEGNPMPSRDPSDTTSLNGSRGSTQAALIVPQPSCRGCETIYYVFTTRDVNDSIRCLEYTRVDMRGNGGKGIILDKNNQTGECNVSERLTSIQNPADSSYWVLSHENGTSKFILKRLTKSGLEDANSPSIGLPHTTKYQGEGQIKFATSGGKMGVVIPGPARNYVEIYNFNDSTGAITPPPITLDLGPAPPSAYGLEFSPDGEKVYVSLRGNDSTESVLYQYDLTGADSTTIASTRIEVARSEKEFGALQYAPDGKIYMAIKDSEYLGVITPSSGDSTEVDFQLDGFYLAGKRSQLGLPNFVQSIIEPPSGPGISAEDVCFGEPVELTTGAICDPLKDKYEWDFGDGSAKGTKQSETHLYAAPGTYTVTLRQYNDCKDTTMTQQVKVNPQPIANLGQDLNVCSRTVTLDSKNPYPNSKYLWFRNGRQLAVDSTASKIQIDSSGRYVVGVLIGDCYSLDTINVILERPPLYSLGPDKKLCTNDTLQLDALPGGASYLWNTGQNTQVIDVTQAGNYSVVVMIPRTNGITCEVTDTVRVDLLPLPNVTVQPEASLCQPNNQSIMLSAGNNMNYQYRWLPGNESTRTITVNRVGVYTVEISTSDGCTEAHAIKVIDLCEPQIFVPDAFSPNGDGQNDQLQVITNHISDQDYEFRVYDRWGELIFRTTNRNEMWDGTYKGRTFPPQTYAWAVQYRSTYFPERGVETKRGAVLIAK
ncbi:PKD domain-containing protein [Siphonobacter sp. SORGH_AS_0500]|uniref:PKD domain-containing protein n=1 Tax=Siphonobacter sp. SORGH_AS_0500 TaxID=1864824 RepID=UPI0028608F8D|nr:PKD domain-containing protein [Siphonobacter sp. SORGH_AS_0500]MDR6193187.1 gliding motility-associated-like protein [Siphonobacter sp. SORGH_AS_0500]